MKAFPPCRFSPDDSRTGVNIGTFPAFLQARREVWTATTTSGNPHLGRGAAGVVEPQANARRFDRTPGGRSARRGESRMRRVRLLRLGKMRYRATLEAASRPATLSANVFSTK